MCNNTIIYLIMVSIRNNPPVDTFVGKIGTSSSSFVHGPSSVPKMTELANVAASQRCIVLHRAGWGQAVGMGFGRVQMRPTGRRDKSTASRSIAENISPTIEVSERTRG